MYIFLIDNRMDNRFGSQNTGIENGGMFNREQLQRLTQYMFTFMQASYATVWKKFRSVIAC